jgi:molecular chaperone DnaK
VENSFKPVAQALKDAGVKAGDINEVVLVGGMTRMPKIQEEVEKFFGKKPNKSVNPDEVVALGAAIQAGVIAGDVQDIVLLDVTPLTLGLETLGGIRTPLIERNTTVPTSKSQVFSTAADNQMQVEINVLQGEREMAADNKSLGRFILDGIPPAPRGVPQIEVKFDIDSNGILRVSAQDKNSGKSTNITIQNATNLSEEEVEKMRAEAEKHAAEDKAKRELAEARNQAQGVVTEIRKQVKDAGDKLPEDDRKAIEEAVTKLDELAQSDSATKEQLEAATQDTFKVAQKLGEINQTAQSAGAEAGSADSDKKSEKKSDEKSDAQDGEVIAE